MATLAGRGRALGEAWYGLARTGCAATFYLGWSLQVRGAHNVPQSGPALLVANHQSYFDPPVIAAAVPRHLTFLARDTLFRNPFLSALVRGLHAVPIDQSGTGIDGLRVVLSELDKGNAVLMFPEGHRSPDGTFQPLQPGVSLLIKRAKAPVVPVGLAGTFHAWSKAYRWPVPSPFFQMPTRRCMAVAVGEPLPPSRFAGQSREQVMATLRDAMLPVVRRAEEIRRK